MIAHRMQQTLDNYTFFLLKRSWLVIFLSVIVSGFIMAINAKNFGFNNDYQVFFGKENPQLLAFHDMQAKYDKSDNALIVVSAKPGHQIFEPIILEAVEEITARAQQELPFAHRVDSVTNYQHTTAQGDDLIVAPLIENAANLSLEDIAQARKIAVSEPTLAGRLMSKTHESTNVHITFEMPQKSTEENTIIMQALRDLTADIEAKYPIDIDLTGMIVVNNAFFESALTDIKTLYPIMYLIIIAMIFLLTRSVSAAVGVLIVITLSVFTTLGLTFFFGLKLTAASAAAPTIVTTLAIADSIHFLMTMLGLMRKGASKRDAIIETMRIDFKPLFLTSLTTVIGFLSLNFSDSPPFRDLGNIVAMGVSAAFIFSICFLPAFLAIAPIKATEANLSFNIYLKRLADFIITNTKTVFTGAMVISIILLSFLPQNKLRDDFVRYFDTSVPFRAATDLVNERFAGFNPLFFSVESGESNGVSNPEFLAKLDQFKTWLETQPEVAQVSIISDTFKRLNMNLHGDDPAYYKLPEQRNQAAQYLLLYELSLPYGLDLNNQLNIDKSATKVSVTISDIPTDKFIAVTERIEQWAAQNIDQKIVGVSSALMFAHISERNVKSMLKGTISALILISFIIMLALRNVRLGLISLIPNILPALLAFGVWGILSGEINLAVAAVTGMTLGIVVDDTVHFLTQYQYAKKQKGFNKINAIYYAFDHVGTAIVITTIVLVAGFTVLSQSDFGLNSDTGKLAGITIFIALFADFIFIPCLLLWFDKETDSAVAVQA